MSRKCKAQHEDTSDMFSRPGNVWDMSTILDIGSLLSFFIVSDENDSGFVDMFQLFKMLIQSSFMQAMNQSFSD